MSFAPALLCMSLLTVCHLEAKVEDLCVSHARDFLVFGFENDMRTCVFARSARSARSGGGWWLGGFFMCVA